MKRLVHIITTIGTRMKIVRKTFFTLVELLMVISIIAIMAAILLPVLGKIKNKVKSTACTNNVKQLVLAANLYSNDFNDYVIPTQWGTTYWNSLLTDFQYIPKKKNDSHVFYCPEAKPHNESTYGTDYSLNPCVAAYSKDGITPDGISGSGGLTATWQKLSRYGNLTFMVDGIGTPSFSSYQDFTAVRWRHNGNANYSILSGAVKNVSFIQRLSWWNDSCIRK